MQDALSSVPACHAHLPPSPIPKDLEEIERLQDVLDTLKNYTFLISNLHATQPDQTSALQQGHKKEQYHEKDESNERRRSL